MQGGPIPRCGWLPPPCFPRTGTHVQDKDAAPKLLNPGVTVEPNVAEKLGRVRAPRAAAAYQRCTSEAAPMFFESSKEISMEKSSNVGYWFRCPDRTGLKSPANATKEERR